MLNFSRYDYVLRATKITGITVHTYPFLQSLTEILSLASELTLWGVSEMNPSKMVNILIESLIRIKFQLPTYFAPLKSTSYKSCIKINLSLILQDLVMYVARLHLAENPNVCGSGTSCLKLSCIWLRLALHKIVKCDECTHAHTNGRTDRREVWNSYLDLERSKPL